MKTYLLKALIPALMLSLVFGGVVNAIYHEAVVSDAEGEALEEGAENDTDTDDAVSDETESVNNEDADTTDKNNTGEDTTTDLKEANDGEKTIDNRSTNRADRPARVQDARAKLKRLIDSQPRLRKAVGTKEASSPESPEPTAEAKVQKQEIKRLRVQVQDFRKEDRKKEITVNLQKAKNARAEARSLRDKEKAGLREKLNVVKDERKKAIVEKISQRFNDILERSTNRLANYLGKVEIVLQRIENRTDEIEDRGIDVTATRLAIANAYAKIDDTRNENTIQTTEVVNLSDSIDNEKTLKTDIQRVRDSLKRKLETLRSRAIGARDAVKNVAQALRDDFTKGKNLQEDN